MDRRRARPRRPAGDAGPRGSSGAPPADRRPPERAGSPPAPGTEEPGCEGGTRASPTPCGRAGPPPGCPPLPSSAGPADGRSDPRRAIPRHTPRHTPNCDRPARRVQQRTSRKGAGRCAGGPRWRSRSRSSVSRRRRRPRRHTSRPGRRPRRSTRSRANSSELNTPCPRRLPDPVAGRAQPVHGIEPAGRTRRARHLGGPPGEHGRPLRRSREPRSTDQLRGGRLLPDAGARRRSLLREPQDDGRELRAGRHLLLAPQPGPRLGDARATSRVLPTGPTATLDEQGPSYVEVDGRALLYFSRSSASVPGDIYVSEQLADGSFGPASPVAELNTAANDIQPNVRKDGLEVVFSSNHAYPGALGGQDVYVSTRASGDDPWSAPVNLGTRRQHLRRRDAPLPLLGRADAPVRAGARARGDVRHLRRHPRQAHRSGWVNHAG